MALAAYRNLLRATRIAFKGDERILFAARDQARAGFRANASLSPSDEAVAPAVQHANEVASMLRANVVQGRKEGDAYSTSFYVVVRVPLLTVGSCRVENTRVHRARRQRYYKDAKWDEGQGWHGVLLNIMSSRGACV